MSDNISNAINELEAIAELMEDKVKKFRKLISMTKDKASVSTPALDKGDLKKTALKVVAKRNSKLFGKK